MRGEGAWWRLVISPDNFTISSVAFAGRGGDGFGVSLALVGLELPEGEEAAVAPGALDHLLEALWSLGGLLLQEGMVLQLMGPLQVLVQVGAVGEGHGAVRTGEELTSVDCE